MIAQAVPARTFTIAELFPDRVADLVGTNVTISGISLDSRTVEPGDLYIALKGARVNGLDFVDQAIARGAVAIAWESGESDLPASVTSIFVEDLRHRTGGIASRFFGEPSASLDVVGVTGTNGKTSVAHFTSQLLTQAGQQCGFIGTLGYGYGDQLQASGYTTPDALAVHRVLAQFKADHAKAVSMEVSSHALDQGRVNCVVFNTGVFTNLTRDHIDYHGSMEAYAESKRELFSWPGMKNAVINADDPFGVELIEEINRKIDCVAYSVNGPIAGVENLLAKKLEVIPEGLRFEVEGFGQTAVVESGLMGIFNAQNLLATLGVLMLRGLDLKTACAALSTVKPVPGRMQRVDEDVDYSVIVDYAHTPDALQKALLAARAHTRKQLVCVFGCGGDRDIAKRAMMGEIAEKYADRLILTNDNPRGEDPEAIIRQIQSGMQHPDDAMVIQDRREAIAASLASAGAGDCLLIAGKGHESKQVIGDQHLSFNDADVVRELSSGDSQ